MNEPETGELLRRAARRARAREGFVASALEDYQRAHGLDDAGLAALLGCSSESLPRLALCRLPAPERFREGVEEIAAYTGADPASLAHLLRQAETARVFRGRSAPLGGRGLLAAARDRISEEPADYEAAATEQEPEESP